MTSFDQFLSKVLAPGVIEHRGRAIDVRKLNDLPPYLVLALDDIHNARLRWLEERPRSCEHAEHARREFLRFFNRRP